MDEFFGAKHVIQLHAAAAIGAMIVGLTQFLGRKGTGPHRAIGWIFVILMAIVAISSFFIHTICTLGGFSVIHLLSVATLAQLSLLVLMARRHDVEGHRRLTIGLYVFALILAGLFTLLPGRLMHDVVFGTHLASNLCTDGGR